MWSVETVRGTLTQWLNGDISLYSISGAKDNRHPVLIWARDDAHAVRILFNKTACRTPWFSDFLVDNTRYSPVIKYEEFFPQEHDYALSPDDYRPALDYLLQLRIRWRQTGAFEDNPDSRGKQEGEKFLAYCHENPETVLDAIRQRYKVHVVSPSAFVDHTPDGEALLSTVTADQIINPTSARDASTRFKLLFNLESGEGCSEQGEEDEQRELEDVDLYAKFESLVTAVQARQRLFRSAQFNYFTPVSCAFSRAANRLVAKYELLLVNNGTTQSFTRVDDPAAPGGFLFDETVEAPHPIHRNRNLMKEAFDALPESDRHLLSTEQCGQCGKPEDVYFSDSDSDSYVDLLTNDLIHDDTFGQQYWRHQAGDIPRALMDTTGMNPVPLYSPVNEKEWYALHGPRIHRLGVEACLQSDNSDDQLQAVSQFHEVLRNRKGPDPDAVADKILPFFPRLVEIFKNSLTALDTAAAAAASAHDDDGTYCPDGYHIQVATEACYTITGTLRCGLVDQGILSSSDQVALTELIVRAIIQGYLLYEAEWEAYSALRALRDLATGDEHHVAIVAAFVQLLEAVPSLRSLSDPALQMTLPVSNFLLECSKIEEILNGSNNVRLLDASLHVLHTKDLDPKVNARLLKIFTKVDSFAGVAPSSLALLSRVVRAELVSYKRESDSTKHKRKSRPKKDERESDPKKDLASLAKLLSVLWAQDAVDADYSCRQRTISYFQNLPVWKALDAEAQHSLERLTATVSSTSAAVPNSGAAPGLKNVIAGRAPVPEGLVYLCASQKEFSKACNTIKAGFIGSLVYNLTSSADPDEIKSLCQAMEQSLQVSGENVKRLVMKNIPQGKKKDYIVHDHVATLVRTLPRLSSVSFSIDGKWSIHTHHDVRSRALNIMLEALSYRATVNSSGAEEDVPGDLRVPITDVSFLCHSRDDQPSLFYEYLFLSPTVKYLTSLSVIVRCSADDGSVMTQALTSFLESSQAIVELTYLPHLTDPLQDLLEKACRHVSLRSLSLFKPRLKLEFGGDPEAVYRLFDPLLKSSPEDPIKLERFHLWSVHFAEEPSTFQICAPDLRVFIWEPLLGPKAVGGLADSLTAGHCPNLQNLHVQWTNDYKITDRAPACHLAKAVRSCPGLRRLSMSSFHLDQDFLAALTESILTPLPLSVLLLEHCKAEASLEDLLRALPLAERTRTARHPIRSDIVWDPWQEMMTYDESVEGPRAEDERQSEATGGDEVYETDDDFVNLTPRFGSSNKQRRPRLGDSISMASVTRRHRPYYLALAYTSNTMSRTENNLLHGIVLEKGWYSNLRVQQEGRDSNLRVQQEGSYSNFRVQQEGREHFVRKR